MRDPNRINPILAVIESILNKIPEMTVGKLVVLAGGDPAVYYLEDNGFVRIIREKTKIFVPDDELILNNSNLKRIAEVWKKLPDLRFGQLICNIIRDTEVLSKVSDETLAEVLEECYGGSDEKN